MTSVWHLSMVEHYPGFGRFGRGKIDDGDRSPRRLSWVIRLQRPQLCRLGGNSETLIVGVYGFVRITSVTFRVACAPLPALSKPVHPQPKALLKMPLGGGEGNRTPVQNASRLPELQPCFRLWGRRLTFSRGYCLPKRGLTVLKIDGSAYFLPA